MISSKLTEDQTVLILIKFLEKNNFHIKSYCLGQTRGYDIVAKKGEKELIIEVKGAKASKNSPTKKRESFDSGQIKTHFGKAIVKSLETKITSPNSEIVIAHPDDKKIRQVIGKLIPTLSDLNIIHFWVNKNGTVQIENKTSLFK